MNSTLERSFGNNCFPVAMFFEPHAMGLHKLAHMALVRLDFQQGRSGMRLIMSGNVDQE